eukprot:3874651-Pyramimonas_sp.AAC.1
MSRSRQFDHGPSVRLLQAKVKMIEMLEDKIEERQLTEELGGLANVIDGLTQEHADVRLLLDIKEKIASKKQTQALWSIAAFCALGL